MKGKQPVLGFNQFEKPEMATLVLQRDRIVAINREALQIFKGSRDLLLGKSFLSLSAPHQGRGRDSVDMLREKTALTLTLQNQFFEWRCKRSDGEIFIAQAMMKPVTRDGHKLVQLMLQIVPDETASAAPPHSDATREKVEPGKDDQSAEVKFHERLSAFDVPADLLRMGIEGSNDAIMITDLDGRIRYVNPAFERLYGYGWKEVLGKTPQLLMPADLAEEFYEAFWKQLLDGQVISAEITNRHKNGDLLEIDSTNNSIIDPDGNLAGFISIHRDVTERKHMDSEAQQALTRLQKRFEDRTAELTSTNRLLEQRLLELSRIRSELEQRNRVHESLNELANRTAAELRTEDVFQSAIDSASRLLDATTVLLMERDTAGGQWQITSAHHTVDAAIAERAAAAGMAIDVDTARNDDDVAVYNADDGGGTTRATRALLARYGVRSAVRLTIRGAEDIRAVIDFWDSRRSRILAADDVALLRTIARQTAISLENINLYKQLQQELNVRRDLEGSIQASLERRGRQIRLTAQVSADIIAATSLDDLYQRIVTGVKEQFGYYHTQILLYDPGTNAVSLEAGYGDIGHRMKELGYRVPLGAGLIGAAAATGQTVLLPDVSADTEWRSHELLPATRGEVAVPIVLGDVVLGVLVVQSDKVNELTEDDQFVLESLCAQIAIAIESTRLRQEMDSRILELNRLQRIMSHEGWQAFRAENEAAILGYRFTDSTIQPIAPAVEADIGDPKGGDRFAEVGPEREKAIITPMTVRGEIIGALGIETTPDQPLTEEDKELIESISIQVAEALESARLLEQTQRHAVEMEAVAGVSAIASTILDAHKLLKTVTQLTRNRFDLYHVAVFVLDEDQLLLASGTGFPEIEDYQRSPLILNLDQRQSLVARAARTRQPVVVNDVNLAEDYLAHPLLKETRSELAVPLVVGEILLGVFDLQDNALNRFSKDEVRIHTTLAAQVAVALQNANLYAQQLETTRKLQEVDRLKSEFLANMSHELRTPLNSIIGFADVLLEGIDGELSDRMQQDVTLIRDSGRHLKTLIGEMLDMSKIEAGMMELYFEEIAIAELANEVLAFSRSLAKDKELNIEMDLDATLTTVEADRTRLTQILLNLMSNAVKFTEKGDVHLSMSRGDADLLVAVRDTGIGIREQDIPSVFEQFRQINGGPARAAGGTGLGLPISKRLIELHGGRLWVESEVGVGSTFTFTIPLSHSKADQEP